jgi:hypothetical protein
MSRLYCSGANPLLEILHEGCLAVGRCDMPPSPHRRELGWLGALGAPAQRSIPPGCRRFPPIAIAFKLGAIQHSQELQSIEIYYKTRAFYQK